MTDESDYRDAERDQADREKHLAELRAASAKREESIANLTTQIGAARHNLHHQEIHLAEQRRQLELDAETIRIAEAWHANRTRAAEALSDQPFRRAAYDALNTLRLEHMAKNAEAGARVADAQRSGTWDELHSAWAEYATHNAIGNDLARLMVLMGRPIDLVSIDTAYPDDAPTAGAGLNMPDSEQERQQ